MNRLQLPYIYPLNKDLDYVIIFSQQENNKIKNKIRARWGASGAL
ncbi:hypothetical protein CLCAR_1225 [Clostridium carboxidivorans P7]|nr:hypothetical protein CLCAR_1225 [Clostridium carboxidivorans P7]